MMEMSQEERERAADKMQTLAEAWRMDVNHIQASPFVVAHVAFIYFMLACDLSGVPYAQGVIAMLRLHASDDGPEGDESQ